MVPRENKDNTYAKFGETNKDYYGFLKWPIKLAKTERHDVDCYSTNYEISG